MRKSTHLALAGLLALSVGLAQAGVGLREITAMPDAGHGALLSPKPPLARMSDLAVRLLGDPPGFDRSQKRAVDSKIVRHFEQHLLAPAPAR